MSLERINREDVMQCINSALHSISILKDFDVVNFGFTKIKQPTVFDQYDVWLTSSNNRKILIRVCDFHKNQRVIFLINKNDHSSVNNIDISDYFINDLNDLRIKQITLFKANSIEELHKELIKVLNYIFLNLDETLVNILNGKIWPDLPFDWHGYK